MSLLGILQPKSAEIMAIAAAALFPLGLVFLKKGYDHSTPLSGTVVVTAINAAVLWIAAAMFSNTALLLSSAVAFFIIGGVIGHGVARLLQFTGVHFIGPARNTTALATSALFSSAIAVIFLGERLTVAIAAGTIAIVGGVAVLAWESKKAKWKLIYLLFPITAAFLYGVMNSVYKEGLKAIPDALLAAAVGLTAALATLTVFAVASSAKSQSRIKMPKMGKALPLFMAAGLINSFGLILNFEALRRGNVSVVAPLISSQPLFAALFGWLLLHEKERISLHVVLGAVVVVAGIAVITAF